MLNRLEPIGSDVGAPTPERMLIAAWIYANAKGDPAKIARIMARMRRALVSRRKLGSSVVRIRSPQHDAATMQALEEAIAWLEAIGPVMVVMAGED